jgi:hypothetical protein
MANYYGKTRTSYFPVKDKTAFLDATDNLTGDVIHTEEDGETLYAIISSDDDGELGYFDPDSGTFQPVDFKDFFETHLVDDWVVIITHAGSEKSRYNVGRSWAYNNKRESEYITINSIYSYAEALGEHFTRAEY